MRETTSIPTVCAIGLDLGDRQSHLCCLDEEREVCRRLTAATTRAGMTRAFSRLPRTLVVMEVGTHSPWVSRLIEGLGFEVIVADTRQLKLITQSRQKTDRRDAELLARLGAADRQLLRPIKHRGDEGQLAATLLRARDALVSARTDLVNHVRGAVKTHGFRLRRCSTNSFEKHLHELPEQLNEALAPLMLECGALTARIKGLERKLREVATQSFPETLQLRQVCGVGPLTSLAFAVVVQDPARFQKTRQVGAYLGLVPAQHESGDRSPQLRISKAGDAMVRRYLVNAAHYILGPFGKPCDLRDWGLELAARGGKAGKKRAVVAVARKLSTLLLALWKSGEEYDPHRNRPPEASPGETFMGQRKAS